MRVGSLRNRITIYRPPGPDDVDEIGQPTDEWPLVTTVWAAIEPLHGRELFAAQQVNAEVTTRLRIRYRKGVDRTMKAICGNDEFEFLYIIHKDYKKRELHIMCKERQ